MQVTSSEWNAALEEAMRVLERIATEHREAAADPDQDPDIADIHTSAATYADQHAKAVRNLKRPE